MCIRDSASLRSAVDSMKMGAVDYIAKPFDHDEMLQAVARILRDRQAATSHPAEPAGKASASAKAGASNNNGEIGIIGSCPPMQDLYSKIRKVAPTDSNVLIQGESGTGKELVARALHNLSRRATSSLPVPDSPWTSTLESVGATLRILLYRSCMGGQEPMMPISPLLLLVPAFAATLALPTGSAGLLVAACRSRRMRATAWSISSWSNGLAM